MTDPGRAGHRAYMSSAMEMEAKVKEVEAGYLEKKKTLCIYEVLRQNINEIQRRIPNYR